MSNEQFLEKFIETMFLFREKLPLKKIVVSKEYFDVLERAFQKHQESLPYSVNLPLAPRVLKFCDVEIAHE